MNKKKNLIMVSLLLVGFSFLFSSLDQQESAKELFERALYLEETKGDLEKAIEVYNRVVKEFPDERVTAAKAQLHIGLCYEKLGLKEAQKAYQNVIDKYPEQTEEVKIAREKLSVLLKAQVLIEKGDNNFMIRKVMSLDVNGESSPDGCLLSFVDWDTGKGELAVIEIATGKKRRLTHKAPGEKCWYFVIDSIFSPDGKKIAFTRWKDDDTVDLRIINVDGSGQRILLSDKEIDYPRPCDWTPDGKYILGILTKKDKTNQIAFVSASDGNVRIIKEFGQNELGKLCLSPDGRWIGYDIPQNKEPGKRDIHFLSADGNREVPLVKHPADDRLLGWALNGKWVLFSSDRQGTWDTWIIPVKDGKLQDNPRLIKRDFGQMGLLGIVPMGFTQKGSFYYGIRTWLEDVYVATLDMEKGELLAPPEKTALRFEGSNAHSEWSPDGKYLAYISRRGPEGLKSQALCIQSIDKGEVRELFPEVNGYGRLSWFPDGKSILVMGKDKENRTGLFKVDTKTGEASPIVTGGSGFYSPRCSPDGKRFFYALDFWEEKIFRIMSYDLETKQKKEIYRSSSQINRMDISPDGELLAFEDWEGCLKVISTEGGKPQVLLELEPGEGIKSVTWSPDGKDIFISKSRKGAGKTGKCELWRIPAKGGKSMKFPLVVDGLYGLTVHPDGRRIAFVSFQFSSAVWIMENFLPERK